MIPLIIIDRITRLFSEGCVDEERFPARLSLFERQVPYPRLELLTHDPGRIAPFTREELYRCLMESCEVAGLHRSATWF